MKNLKIILLCSLFCNLTNTLISQVIKVDDTKTAQQLIENILINSSCANVSNFSVSGDTFTGTNNSYGSFDNQGGSFPFTSGIILNTWSIINAVGPYTSGQNGGGDSSWLGDPDLDKILNINSINATVLEFDFIPLTNHVSFNYIFASNEYQLYYPCEYSDGFSFLIKEKGSPMEYKNLAVLPNTTTPVSSQNVHPFINPYTGIGGNHPGCPPINEFYFDKFNSSTSPINYSGQTKIMNANTTVKAGVTYHIKLVIADDDNEYYDSAVFLEAGSFSSKIDLGTDRLFATNNPICFGETTIIDTQLPASLGYSYKWYIDNVLQPETTPNYTVTKPGNYRVEVELGTPTCTTSDEIKIEYTSDFLLINSTLVQCDDNGDGFSAFNLTKADNIIKNNNSNLSSVLYFENLTDAKANLNAIPNTTNYTNKNSNQILFARVTNANGCEKYAELNLQLSNTNIPTQNPFTTCDGDTNQDGLYHFDLNTEITPTLLKGLPPGLTAEYYLKQTDAIFQFNPLPNIYENAIPNQQIIYARIVIGTDCYDITPITLVVNTFLPINFQDERIPICNSKTINLSVNNNYNSYLWNTGETTNTIVISTTGDYSVTVTDLNGCEATKKFDIFSSEIGEITATVINNFAGNENSVLLEYSGNGDYEFSLDGSYFQDSPEFIGIAPGEYFAFTRDKNGCGISSPYALYVIDYPRYFTPNGDGFNDTWHIKNLNLLTKSTLTIYDRYGKLLKELSSKSVGWNGSFNGYELPAGDYWFNLNFEDGKIIKGHFSLKR